MIKLFAKTAFQLLKPPSRLPPLFKKFSLSPQFYPFSTSKALNWDQCFPYNSIVNEASFQKALPTLESFPKERILDFQKVLNRYLVHRDPSLLSEKEAKDLILLIYKMGSLTQNANNHHEAEAYFLEALDITKKSKANNPSTVILIQNSLGWAYYGLGQDEESLICLEGVRDMIEENPDFVDFDTGRVRNWYFTSFVLARQGKLDQAIELLNKTVAANYKDPYAPPTDLTISAFAFLGQIYQETDLEKAFGVWEEGMRFALQKYGKDADGLQDLYRAIGKAYFKQNNYAMGLENMKRCIELSKKYNKVDFDDFFILAFAEYTQKDYEGFLKSAQVFMDFYGGLQRLDEKKIQISLVMCDTLYKQGDIPLAEKSFGRLVTHVKALYGENSVEVVGAYMDRVEHLSGQETTKSYYRTALTEAINVSKTCESLNTTSRINLFLKACELSINDEEWGQALEYLKTIHELSSEKHLVLEGDQLEHIYLLTAKTYSYLGRFQEAMVYAARAKALCEVTGNSSSRMADINESIKNICKSMENV